MTKPRSTQVSLSDTPWYHVVSRCVRRAFLCGDDRVSGRNFDHRRGWIEAHMAQLASVFAIDVAAYAVMSNHYHIVVRIDAERSRHWSVEEVLRRWTQLFTGPLLVQRYQSAARAEMAAAEIAKVVELAESYRARLADLSWFMRVLNETIAREANKEDGVKGRFWEGRFKSQALLDEQALLAALAYVDLNPIRAGIAETPEASAYTSIEARLYPERAEQRMAQAKTGAGQTAPNDVAAATDESQGEESEQLPLAPLMPFDATGREAQAIPFAFDDYLELVETLGRCVHPTKRGRIPERMPKLLERLDIDAKGFSAYAARFLKEFGAAVGTPAHLTELAVARNVKFLRGMRAAREAFEKKAA